MRILLTGATGFIGGHLIRSLPATHQVFCLVRAIPPHPAADVEWVVQDLTTPLEGLPRSVDAIVHLAQSRHYRHFPERSRDIVDVNVNGTFRLLEYARESGARIFVFASTGGLYGYSYERFVETDPVSPLNFYLASKYSAELLIGNYRRFFRTVVFRFFFVYGPGQRGMLISELLRKVRAGERIVVQNSPGFRLNPIYIDDAALVIEPALELERDGLFNVAGDDVLTVLELVRTIEKVVGRRAEVIGEGEAPLGDLVGDNSQMKKVLGVFPAVGLEEGLRRMHG